MRAARPLATETYCSLPSTHYLLLTTYYSLRTYVVREDHRLELAQRLDGRPPVASNGNGILLFHLVLHFLIGVS